MSEAVSPFRHNQAQTVFDTRHKRDGVETWDDLARVVVDDVCKGLLPEEECHEIYEAIRDMKFIPGGRYLAYAGRPVKYFQNCYALLGREDTREEWARLYHDAASCLMTGGGIGIDYSVFRATGLPLGRTGGVSSGPLPMMQAVNDIGRASIQGGGRRSAIYASLDREHGDVLDFLAMKNWHDIDIPGTSTTLGKVKEQDFDFPCPMDHTNVSVNYSDEWLGMENRDEDEVFRTNCLQAMKTGEPGFSFNFGDQASFTGRNACTEFVTDDDSDACNLGSVNMSRISSTTEFRRICELGSKFLYCGTVRSDVPYARVKETRDRNRRLGLGLMGVHEWLLRRGSRYEVTPDLHAWLQIYEVHSIIGANEVADRLGLPRPKAYRAIAPTGTIGILAGTTTGIEPIYAPSYRRRYRVGMEHHYQYVVDPTATVISEEFGLDPDSFEGAIDLATDVERRIAFQADVQDYVDMAISSTVNLPAFGTEHNNEDLVNDFARTLAKYAPRLRGITFYPDGSRGGQPLESVPYSEAIKHEGQSFKEEVADVCDITGKGTCND